MPPGKVAACGGGRILTRPPRRGSICPRWPIISLARWPAARWDLPTRGWCFLGAGVFSWLSLEPAILQRLRSAGELPTPLRTSLGIQLAPALVACSAWLSVNGGEADTFAKLLFGYGLLQLLFMLRLMPRYLRQPFNASFWSFSFGISALATTGLHLGQARADGFFHHLAMPLFIFSNLVVGLLLLRTILLLVSGKLLGTGRPGNTPE